MRIRAIFNSINPFTGLAGMVVMGALLVLTIFVTWLDIPWIAFLSGTLTAAVIALVNRLSYAEKALGAVRDNVRCFDEELSAMVAYVNADGTVRLHNQAFRSWLHARRETIDGRQLRDVVGLTTFAQLKAGLDSAWAGTIVHEILVHEGRGGVRTRLYTQYLPHIGARDSIPGAFIIQTDMTGVELRAGAALPPVERERPRLEPAAPAPAAPTPPATAEDPAEPERRIYVNTITEELTDWKNAGDRLRAALDNDEFCLHCQAIAPVAARDPVPPPFLEMLLRLREEEEGLMPPGAFLPLAEEYGLLPELDRWVVRHVLDWALRARRAAGRRSTASTSPRPPLSDDAFAGFVGDGSSGSAASQAPCCASRFTRMTHLGSASDAAWSSRHWPRPGAARAVRVRANAADYGLLKRMPVDYLKIDGQRHPRDSAANPVDLIKLKAICRVARSTNRLTVAEFVEGDESLAILQRTSAWTSRRGSASRGPSPSPPWTDARPAHGRGAQNMCWPPLIEMLAPVMNAASSEAR